jgi:hypothetical protein
MLEHIPFDEWCNYKGAKPIWKCTVQGIDIQWAGTPLVSSLTRATIILRAPLIKPSPEWDNGLELDRQADLRRKPILHLLLLWVSQSKTRPEDFEYGSCFGYLVIEPTGKTDKEYRRVGFLDRHFDKTSTFTQLNIDKEVRNSCGPTILVGNKHNRGSLLIEDLERISLVYNDTMTSNITKRILFESRIEVNFIFSRFREPIAVSI